jgi:hypothetical protein
MLISVHEAPGRWTIGCPCLEVGVTTFETYSQCVSRVTARRWIAGTALPVGVDGSDAVTSVRATLPSQPAARILGIFLGAAASINAIPFLRGPMVRRSPPTLLIHHPPRPDSM